MIECVEHLPREPQALAFCDADILLKTEVKIGEARREEEVAIQPPGTQRSSRTVTSTRRGCTGSGSRTACCTHSAGKRAREIGIHRLAVVKRHDSGQGPLSKYAAPRVA